MRPMTGVVLGIQRLAVDNTSSNPYLRPPLLVLQALLPDIQTLQVDEVAVRT